MLAGTEVVLYNLHPNQKSEDKRNNDHSSLKPIKDDIVIETREITDRGYLHSTTPCITYFLMGKVQSMSHIS